MKRNLIICGLLIAASAALVAAFVLPDRVGHPVTPAMLSAAQQTTGRLITLPPEITQQQIIVVIFILPGCPCSDSYEPITHRISTACQQHATLLGVVAGKAKEATRWQKEHSTPYQVIADPQQQLIEACGAERSAYTALIVDDRLQQLWPGYSFSMLKELADAISTAAQTSPFTIDATDVPEALTSGCLLEDAAE